MFTKFKTVVMNTLGIIATTAVVAAVCWLLFLMGYIRELTTAFWTELGIITILVIFMRIFWYKHTEFKVLTSKEFEDAEKSVKLAITTEITDTDHFDNCIDNINQTNYKTYYNNKTKNITPNNYKFKLRDKLYNFFWLVYPKKRRTKKQAYEQFLNRVSYKASRLYKLSSSNTLTMSKSALIDDRNNAGKVKRSYIIGGTFITIAFTAAVAAIGFAPKTVSNDAFLKLSIYLASILFTIVQTIFAAHISTRSNYISYFNKLLTIVDRYKQFKITNPVGGNYDKPKLET